MPHRQGAHEPRAAGRSLRELNALLFTRLRHVWAPRSRPDRLVRVDAHTYDAAERMPHLTLGALRNLLEHSGGVATAVRAGLQGPDADWLLGLLPRQLGPLIDLRNPAAHGGMMPRDAVLAQREKILGIGQEGIIVRLARTKLRVM